MPTKTKLLLVAGHDNRALAEDTLLEGAEKTAEGIPQTLQPCMPEAPKP